MPSELPFLKERLAEAARYALMRRLLPSIRHHIAGSLQPIGMMAAILERRMKAAAPDLALLGKNSQALGILSHDASAIALRLMTWLAPRDNDLVAVSSAVEESLGLMATELSFRGFSIINLTQDMPTRLPRGILRSVFTASLIALTDGVDGAAQVVVSVSVTGRETRLSITLAPDGKAELIGLVDRAQPYRNLDWDDVQALAEAEGVSLSQDACCVQLRYCLPSTLG